MTGSVPTQVSFLHHVQHVPPSLHLCRCSLGTCMSVQNNGSGTPNNHAAHIILHRRVGALHWHTVGTPLAHTAFRKAASEALVVHQSTYLTSQAHHLSALIPFKCKYPPALPPGLLHAGASESGLVRFLLSLSNSCLALFHSPSIHLILGVLWSGYRQTQVYYDSISLWALLSHIHMLICWRQLHWRIVPWATARLWWQCYR